MRAMAMSWKPLGYPRDWPASDAATSFVGAKIPYFCKVFCDLWSLLTREVSSAGGKSTRDLFSFWKRKVPRLKLPV